jgi:hypothetical protein
MHGLWTKRERRLTPFGDKSDAIPSGRGSGINEAA